jgi:hypothetical protein
MKKEIEKKFKEEHAAGEVSDGVQELRMKLLHYSGSVDALESWLEKELDEERFSIEDVEQWMPFWDGYLDAPEPGFVTRWKVEQERKKGNKRAFAC